MGRKLRHVLIFLLIILKEPNTPDSLGNQITTIHSGAFVNLPELRKLSLRSNQITTIDSGAFANLTQLQGLGLSVNQIAILPFGAFAKLPQLQSLALEKNQITTIPSGFFANLPKLQGLKLKYNQITTVHSGIFSNLPELKWLYLNNNQITTIPSGAFANLPKLVWLYLNNNQITTIHTGAFANLPRLVYLFLKNNQITTIHTGAFANLPKLYRLYLDNNQITTIHTGAFANLPGLEHLFLNNNQITTIHTGAFANLPKLYRLYLDNNQITTIPSGAFKNVFSFNLKLQNNKMTAIPPSVFCLFQSHIRIYLHLDGNPWQCDCRMIRARQIPKLNDKITCAQPAKVKGQKLANVDPKELTCKKPTTSPLTVDSCSAAVSTPSVSITESNTSPSVFKATAVSTANPAENTSKKSATLSSPYEITSDKPESAPSSPQPTASTRIADIQLISHNSHYHWYFKVNVAPISDSAGKTRATLTPPLAITPDKPESVPSVPLPVLIGSVCGPVTGIVLIGAILFTVWYKIKSRRHPLGLNPNVVGGNTNTAVTVSVSNDDHEDTDKLGVQNGQGQDNIQSLNIGNLSHNQVLAALKPNPMCAGTGNAAVSVVASGDDHEYEDIDKPRVKTGQVQSQANTESNTNTTPTVMASGDDQTGQGQSQTNTEPNTNTTATVKASGQDQTGQGQSQAITESNTNTTATVMTSGDNQSGKRGYQSLLKSNTTYTVMASGDDQTGQGQSLDTRNLSIYSTEPTAPQLNTLYTTATVMASGDDQTGQGQSQAITESLDARNLSYGTGPTASQINSVYKTTTVMTSGQDQTGQGQSQANTESNTNTIATVMASGHEQTGQGQS
ncbi:hypothetical protein Bbelb_249270 [Branchiostoma belcheri]|nr:hypothetical protein Bbelb_249270 [Branchiostoma belcheri]